ncbi:MAG: hypothetical protein ABIK28_11130 [Planctomycetota bacterium]
MPPFIMGQFMKQSEAQALLIARLHEVDRQNDDRFEETRQDGDLQFAGHGKTGWFRHTEKTGTACQKIQNMAFIHFLCFGNQVPLPLDSNRDPPGKEDHTEQPKAG